MTNKTAPQIEQWLIEQVADRLEIASSALDVDQPLTEAGLSSREAIMLTGDLEEYLGFDLPPELFYDHPHIKDLAQLLAQGASAIAEGSPSASSDSAVAKPNMQAFLQGQSSLLTMMEKRVQMHADRDAFVYLLEGEIEHTRITYAGLHERAKAIAAHLQQKGLAGERILLLHPSSIDFITGFMGCVYARAIAVPAYPPMKRRGIERIASIVKDAEAKAALVTTDLLEKLRKNKRFDENDLFPNTQLISTDSIENEMASQWIEPATINRDTIAFLQYTSGSTGSPKGVMVSHGNVLHNSMLIAEVSELEEVDAVSHSVSWLPMYHDMGMIGNILYQIATGYTNYFMEPNTFLQRPLLWLKAIDKYNAQHTASPNFAFDHCIERIDPADLNGLDLSSWTLAINGAEPVRASTLDRFNKMFTPHGLRATTNSPSFGMAEATLIVTAVPMDQTANILYLEPSSLESHHVNLTNANNQDAISKVSCGVPLMETIIVDPHSHQRLSDGQVGEIWLRGESIAKGYWNREEETEITFGAKLADSGAGPYMRTGDLGFMYEREMYFTGRIKDLIIIRGSNHYPQDIEQVVQDCHADLTIDGAAAFSVDQHGSERLVILSEVQRTAVRNMDAEAIVEAIRKIVSEEHNLQVYAVALLPPGGLPRTTSGKTQRRLAKLQFLEKELNEIHRWELSVQDLDIAAKVRIIDLTALKEMSADKQHEAVRDYLQEMIAHVLRIPISEIPTDKSLVNLGLDSMHAVEIKGKLEQYLKAEVELTHFLQDTDVEKLTDHVLGLLHSPANGEAHAANGFDLDAMSPEQIQSLVEKIDELSDDQVELLLAKLDG